MKYYIYNYNKQPKSGWEEVQVNHLKIDSKYISYPIPSREGAKLILTFWITGIKRDLRTVADTTAEMVDIINYLHNADDHLAWEYAMEFMHDILEEYDVE